MYGFPTSSNYSMNNFFNQFGGMNSLNNLFRPQSNFNLFAPQSCFFPWFPFPQQDFTNKVNYELDDPQKRYKSQDILNAFDTDKDGKVTKAELALLAGKDGNYGTFSGKDLKKIFASVDDTHNEKQGIAISSDSNFADKNVKMSIDDVYKALNTNKDDEINIEDFKGKDSGLINKKAMSNLLDRFDFTKKSNDSPFSMFFSMFFNNYFY